MIIGDVGMPEIKIPCTNMSMMTEVVVNPDLILDPGYCWYNL